MKENITEERVKQIGRIYSGWFKKLQLRGTPYNELLAILIRASGRYLGIYEEWKYISGYEGLYRISSFGRVSSINYNNTGKERVLDRVPDPAGYSVQLKKLKNQLSTMLIECINLKLKK